MDSVMMYYNREHGVKHYAKLSLKTFFLYLFYLICLFSVPTVQYLSAQISTKDVTRAIIGESHITVEVVSSPADLQKGLSGRQSLPKRHGMLFLFKDSAYHGIWMKDMLMSIDIVWINEFNEIVYIERNVSPNSYPNVFRPQTPARFVLELPAGFVDQHWLKAGDTLPLL